MIDWVAVWRESGRRERQTDGRRPQLAAERGAGLAIGADRGGSGPDAGGDLRGELAERGKRVGYGTVWRFFAAEGISFKKNRARRRARAA